MRQKLLKTIFLAVCYILFYGSRSFVNAQRPKLIVTTDIGQDPDDQQSMVRLLHYANEFELLGIIANADANYEHEAAEIKDKVLHSLIDTYGQLEKNFKMHDPRFPSESYLHSIVKKGCSGNGKNIPVEKYIGDGKDTEGSNWIIKQVDKSTTTINVSVWGGSCDLAQALYDVRKTRTSKQLDFFLKKLRVYFIGKQDSSNQWITENFPRLWLVLAMSHDDNSWNSSYRGMFLEGDMQLTSGDWLLQNVIGQSPLGNLYPDEAYTQGGTRNPYGAMKEGDSPSFLFFFPNGLNVPENPEYGGWGGRFELQRNNFYRDAEDTCFSTSTDSMVTNAKASVFRWRPDFQKDFAARVQWGTNGYETANHAPKVSVNGSNTKSPFHIHLKNGEEVKLDASGSIDADGDALSFEWNVYPEAGTFNSASNVSLSTRNNPRTTIKIPEKGSGTVHLILTVEDNGKKPMVSYRRIILTVTVD
mgnify:CR=1 FL=1